MDNIANDCRTLIMSYFAHRIDFEGYLSELEILHHKYPGIGFDKSIIDLLAWKAKLPPIRKDGQTD